MDWLRPVLLTLGFVTTGAISARVLMNLDRESKRLREVRRIWGPLRRTEADELRIIRRRALFGYSVFFAVSAVALFVTVLKALS